MPPSLEYRKVQLRGEDRLSRPGLLLASISLALANVEFLFLIIWAVLRVPPFGYSADSAADTWGRVILGSLPIVSAGLALAGMFRAARGERPLQALLFASFALTLDAGYGLLLRNVAF